MAVAEGVGIPSRLQFIDDNVEASSQESLHTEDKAVSDATPSPVQASSLLTVAQESAESA